MNFMVGYPYLELAVRVIGESARSRSSNLFESAFSAGPLWEMIPVVPIPALTTQRGSME